MLQSSRYAAKKRQRCRHVLPEVERLIGCVLFLRDRYVRDSIHGGFDGVGGNESFYFADFVFFTKSHG